MCGPFADETAACAWRPTRFTPWRIPSKANDGGWDYRSGASRPGIAGAGLGPLTPTGSGPELDGLGVWVSARPLSLPEARVQDVTQPVPDQVHPEHGGHDAEPREGRDPPGFPQVVAALGEHPAPFRLR